MKKSVLSFLFTLFMATALHGQVKQIRHGSFEPVDTINPVPFVPVESFYSKAKFVYTINYKSGYLTTLKKYHKSPEAGNIAYNKNVFQIDSSATGENNFMIAYCSFRDFKLTLSYNIATNIIHEDLYWLEINSGTGMTIKVIGAPEDLKVKPAEYRG